MDIPGYFKPFVLGLSLVVGLTGCIYHDPYYAGTGHRPYHPYYYPFYYDYYFYPSARVYFNFSTGYYYYPSGRRWIHSRVLPPHIHLDSRDRVITRIEGDKPYLKNKQHIQKYQPRGDYRPDPQIHRSEQIHNLKTYELHQKKQRKYKQEWIIRKKEDKKPLR